MGLFKKIFDLERQVIISLENSKLPLVYFILTFFFAVTLRNFLERFLEHNPFSPQGYMHAYLSYIALVISLTLLLYITTKTKIHKIIKVVFPAFFVLNLAPLLDFVLSCGKRYVITYMFPDKHPNVVLRFFTFFGDFTGKGITPGMRIEIAIALLAVFGYFYLKNSNVFKSLFYTSLTYVLIFWYCAIPFLTKWLLWPIGLECKLGTALLTDFYLFILLFLGILVAYFLHKGMFKAVVKDIRLLRLAHYELMFVLGLVLGIRYGVFSINCGNIMHVVFIPVSIAFAWIYSVVTNNIEDYEIDRVSNKNRPLASSEVSLKDYKKLAWPFLFAALFYSAMVGLEAFLAVLLFIGNYFLYSIPPLRLKRVPFFSKLFISINSLILVMLGFTFVTGSVHDFPKLVVAIFLVGFTTVINFIDIKDYAGDKKAGIKTLPVILGLKKSKLVIGLFFLLAYSSTILIFKEKYMFVTFFLFGLTQFYLLNKKSYNENPVFLVYLLSLIISIMYLWTSGV